jgi:hypothetical protein
MTLMGSGISDYLDPVFLVPYRPTIVRALGEYLAANEDWEVCDWQDLSYDTSLDLLSPGAWEITKQKDTVCTELPLPGDFAAFWEQRPRHLRRNIPRYAEKARQSTGHPFFYTNRSRSVTANACSDGIFAAATSHTRPNGELNPRAVAFCC